MNTNVPEDWQALVDGYLAGTLDEAAFEQLKEGLRRDPALRDAWVSSVRVDTLLCQVAGRGEVFVSTPERGEPLRRNRMGWALAGGALAACLVGLAVMLVGFQPSGDARIEGLSGVAWLSEDRRVGQELEAGDELELASGSLEIHFRSGAVTRLHGPARFEIASSNGGFLHYGEAYSRADTPRSQGFSIQTPTAQFIDRGTEFLTTARKDGFSQMHVTSGAVDVAVEGLALQRLEKGSGMGIEPGDSPVLIRIESGDETPAFNFPTIPPPDSGDWADRSQGHISAEAISEDRKGRESRANLPSVKSGGLSSLVDGRGQTGADHPHESLFFTDGDTGMILLDLGRDVPVARVHTYSWHLNEDYPEMRRRAVQRYTLWGAAGDRPVGMPSSEETAGWTRIARVDTDAFFEVEAEPDRPAQQACAIHSTAPSIGQYRYLLFQVIPTPMPDGMRARHTFFGEIDVFAEEPSEVAAIPVE